MALGGAVLRITQTGVRAIQLLASILVLGIFSYYLVVLKDHHLHISTWIRAVEGISGAAVLYLLFAVVLTLCLGGIRFFAFLAIVLDACFIGAFAAVAILTRGGAHSCNGYVNTPLGSGPSDSKSTGYGKNGFGFGNTENVTYLPNLHLACMLEKSVFAVAILNAILFVISAILQLMLAKHHQHEKRVGPSPANNYTSGTGRRQFWKRKNRHTARDAELGAVGAGALATEKHYHNNVRPSHDTGITGTTVDAPADSYGHHKYGAEPVQPGYPTQGYGHTGQTHGVTPTNANF
jgi:hypothetical protein